MATTSMSLKSFATARNTIRPMRPKPLMPTLIAIALAPERYFRNLYLKKHPPQRRKENRRKNNKSFAPFASLRQKLLQNLLNRLGDVLGGLPQMLEQRAGRGRFAKALEP